MRLFRIAGGEGGDHDFIWAFCLSEFIKSLSEVRREGEGEGKSWGLTFFFFL